VTEDHPLGCHRPRVPDRLCFDGIMIRLVTGCSWVDAERPAGGAVSDTTLRDRRDEWIAAGVFDGLIEQGLAAYDRDRLHFRIDRGHDGNLHRVVELAHRNQNRDDATTGGPSRMIA